MINHWVKKMCMCVYVVIIISIVMSCVIKLQRTICLSCLEDVHCKYYNKLCYKAPWELCFIFSGLFGYRCHWTLSTVFPKGEGSITSLVKNPCKYKNIRPRLWDTCSKVNVGQDIWVWMFISLLWLRKWNRWKQTIHTFHISNKTLRSRPNQLGNQPLRPTMFFYHYTPKNTLDMGIHASRKLWTLPQHWYSCVLGILFLVMCLHLRFWATFLGHEPKAMLTTKWNFQNLKITIEQWYKCSYLNKELTRPLLAMTSISSNMSQLWNQ